MSAAASADACAKRPRISDDAAAAISAQLAALAALLFPGVAEPGGSPHASSFVPPEDPQRAAAVQCFCDLDSDKNNLIDAGELQVGLNRMGGGRISLSLARLLVRIFDTKEPR